jgi:small subunit ribosomal protein S4e
MHIKRKTIPKSWPLPRKAVTFVMSPNPGKNKERSIALGVFLRDLLNVVKTMDEAKRSINSKEIEINGKNINDEKFPVGIFDRIFIKKIGKYFTLHLNDKGKLVIKEINTNIYSTKPVKVINKTMLKNKKLQINTEDGYNFLSDKEIRINDTILVNLKNGKIEKVLPLTKGTTIFVLSGKNIGESGKIINIKDKNAEVEINKDKKTIPIKNIIGVEENEFK